MQETYEHVLNSTNQKMQIKTIRRYHLTPIRMSVINKRKDNIVSEAVEKMESFYTVGGDVNWHSLCGKQYKSSSKNQK